VHRLRKTLGGAEWLLVQGDTYALKPGIEFDATTFERDANAALRAKDTTRLARAVQLYRGDFFANASAGEWHLALRDRLRELYAKALAALARSSADPDAWQRLVDFDPLDEDAARNLMTSLGKQGDTAGAARVYRRLVDALRRELDVEPEPETVALHEKVKGKR
jgi:DNA-binding SARP family transcriptional activator